MAGARQQFPEGKQQAFVYMPDAMHQIVCKEMVNRIAMRRGLLAAMGAEILFHRLGTIEAIFVMRMRVHGSGLRRTGFDFFIDLGKCDNRRQHGRPQTKGYHKQSVIRLFIHENVDNQSDHDQPDNKKSGKHAGEQGLLFVQLLKGLFRIGLLGHK